MESVAKRYAESLFDLAKEENAVEAYNNDASLIQEVFETDPSIVQFFSHVLISDDDKLNLIDTSFKGQVQPYVLNFLKLLVKKRRIRYVVNIMKAFKTLTNDYLGIVEGIIYSPYELSEEEIRKIEKAVSHKENKNIQLSVRIDPKLIGGIKVALGTKVYDGSIQQRVETLKKELLRK